MMLMHLRCFFFNKKCKSFDKSQICDIVDDVCKIWYLGKTLAIRSAEYSRSLKPKFCCTLWLLVQDNSSASTFETYLDIKFSWDLSLVKSWTQFQIIS